MKHDGNDLLRRQDCINAIEEITSSMVVCVNTDECHGMKRMQRQAAIELANMPSVQPEIIHCKECKKQDIDNVFRSMWCHEMQVFVKPNEFCSRAERRTDG